MSRRDLLRGACAGFGAVGLSALLGGAAMGATPTTQPFPHLPARAKRVIFLFMNGGPSHVDTFDPKPALQKHAGEQPSGKLFKKSKGSGFMPSPLAFEKRGRSGIDVSESLPHLGRVIDDCCVIRSMHTDVPNHEPALLQMCT
jgi:hypothetical protein